MVSTMCDMISWIDENARGMDEKEFIEKVKGKKIMKLRIGDSGFDVVFEDGIVLETYDFCLLYGRMKEMCKECNVPDCEALGRELHEKLLKRFVDRSVVYAEYNVNNCVFVFHLDNGDSVCIPSEYGYVIGVEVDGDAED